MRNILITEEQANHISNKMGLDIPKEMSKDLENVFCNFSDSFIKLYKKSIPLGYNMALENFNDNIDDADFEKVVNKFVKLLNICKKKEKNIKEQLEKLCAYSVFDTLNVKEDEFTLSCKLVDSINGTKQFPTKNTFANDDYEYEDMGEINREQSEVIKRRFLDMVIVGASLELTNKVLKKCNSELFELDEDLPHLYSKLFKLNEYIMFKSKISICDKTHYQGGFNEVKLGTEENMAEVKSYGITFTVLLAETIRGILELIISNGLPDNKSAILNILGKADFLEAEPWDMRVGRHVWKIITCGNTEVSPTNLVYILSKVDANEIVEYIDELAYSTKRGKAMSNRLVELACEMKEKEDFDFDMEKKMNEPDIIEDEYFMEGEL